MKQKIVKILISLVIVSFALFFVSSEWQNIKTLRIHNFSYLTLLVPSYFIFIAINGLLYLYALIPFGYKTSVELGLVTSFLGSIGNIILPLKGGLVGSGYLYQKHGKVPLLIFLMATAALQIAVFWLTSILGLFSLFLVDASVLESHWYMAVAFLGLALGIPLFFVLNQLFHNTWSKFLPKSVAEGLGGLKNLVFSKAMFSILLLTLANLFLMSFNIYASMKSLGVDVSFAKTLASGVFSSFSILVSVTPSGLGIRESFLYFSSKIFEIPTLPLVMTGVIDRVITLFVSVAFFLVTFKRVKYLLNESNESARTP